MKIYISVPIGGRFPEDVVGQIREIKSAFNDPTLYFVSTIEANKDSAFFNAPRSEVLGNNIKALLRCDLIYLGKGWIHSSECRAEYIVARLYGKNAIALNNEPEPFVECHFEASKKERKPRELLPMDWGLIVLQIMTLLMLAINITLLIIR